MTQKFEKLKKKMKPGNLKKAKIKSKEMIAHMPGVDIRLSQFK